LNSLVNSFVRLLHIFGTGILHSYFTDLKLHVTSLKSSSNTEENYVWQVGRSNFIINKIAHFYSFSPDRNMVQCIHFNPVDMGSNLLPEQCRNTSCR
jgi:hypothetical protein